MSSVEQAKRSLTGRALAAMNRRQKTSTVVKRAATSRTVESVDGKDALLNSLSERAFQKLVIQALQARGYLVWHVPDSRLMAAGLPDLICVHPTRLPRRVLFFELKTATGRVSRKQREAIVALSDVYGVWADVIRPSDWPSVLEDL
jgi:hypothetical protein